MSPKPLVSVIIPFFNAERFFSQAIESVLAQTYKEWELLLVDDGSRDNSSRIASEYRDRNPEKVFYLEHGQHANKGTSASRNLGILKAKGEYIATLDADDVWVETKLDQQVKIMQDYPNIGMVYGTPKYWYSWTNNPRDKDKDYVSDLKIHLNTIYKPPILLTLALESKAITLNPSSMMVRRDAVEAIGGFEDSFTGMHDDQVFQAKMCMKYPVYVANSCWDFYRQHPDSLSTVAVKNGQELSSDLFYLNWLRNYFLNNNVKDQELLTALEKRIFMHKHHTLYRMQELASATLIFTKSTLKDLAQRVLPSGVYQQLRNLKNVPPVGGVNFGDLRRLQPIGKGWGFGRGTPLDRYYIEKFLASRKHDIAGRVLEIGDSYYTDKFGEDRVTKSDVLNHIKASTPETTFVGDITDIPHIPADTFDCIVFTQTLQLIYEIRPAIETLYRILKPGGILLATVSGISQRSDRTWRDFWYWNFTSTSTGKLFDDFFPHSEIEVQGYGNVLVAISFLHGIVAEELSEKERDYYDPSYEIVISIRAVKLN